MKKGLVLFCLILIFPCMVEAQVVKFPQSKSKASHGYRNKVWCSFQRPLFKANYHSFFRIVSIEPEVAANAQIQSVALLDQPLEKDASDHWFGRDKAYHFLVCAALSGAGTWGLKEAHNDEPTSFGIAFGFTMGLGIGKEVWDKHHPGHQASWKDLTADLVGALVGGLIVTAF